MRNILATEAVTSKENFMIWFIMNCFPEGIDEESDMTVYDVIEDNYSFDSEWFDHLTNYYDGVFEENDGYTDNPNSLKVNLNNHNELLVEFHPGDIIFFLNNKEIGCTGPNYEIKAIPFDEYIELTKNLDYYKQLFLLPMASVEEEEKAKFREIIMPIISKCGVEKSDEKIIVEIIVDNCTV